MLSLPTPGFVPGAIITASVVNRVENPESTGKYRPVLLMAIPDRFGIRPVVAGLTTKPLYATGAPRLRLYPVQMYGGVSYLWSGHLIRLTEGSYRPTVIGWLNPDDAEAVLAHIPEGELQCARREAFLASVHQIYASQICR